MPEKGEKMSDVERAKRIRETAREAGTDNDPAAFDRAFERVVKPQSEPDPPRAKPKAVS